MRLQVLIFVLIQLILNSNASYRAAVVDYADKNIFIEVINKVTNEATSQNLDILVFPSLNSNNLGDALEPLALTKVLPPCLSPKFYENLDILVFPSLNSNNLGDALEPLALTKVLPPCLSPKFYEPLKLLSCAARNASMYVVTNIKEKHQCADKYEHYSANLVFDRKGHLVSINRKPIHASLCNLSIPNAPTFSTDFGVTFLHLHDTDVINPNLKPSRMSYTAIEDCPNSSSYRLSVSAEAKSGLTHIGLHICSLLVCPSDDDNLCTIGMTKNSTEATFEKIKDSGHLSEESVRFPTTNTNDISNPSQVAFDTVKTRHVSFYLTDKKSNLGFGISSQDFTKDISELSKYVDSVLDENVNFFDYLWIRAKVLIFIVSIYVLEQI